MGIQLGTNSRLPIGTPVGGMVRATQDFLHATPSTSVSPDILHESLAGVHGTLIYSSTGPHNVGASLGSGNATYATAANPMPGYQPGFGLG